MQHYWFNNFPPTYKSTCVGGLRLPGNIRQIKSCHFRKFWMKTDQSESMNNKKKSKLVKTSIPKEKKITHLYFNDKYLKRIVSYFSLKKKNCQIIFSRNCQNPIISKWFTFKIMKFMKLLVWKTRLIWLVFIYKIIQYYVLKI